MNPNTLVWQHVIHACFGNVGNQTFLQHLPVVDSNTTFPQRIENVMNTFTQRCVATKPLYNQTKTLWKCFLLAGMLLSDDVTYQFVLSSVVSKHLLLALSVLCLFAELTIHALKDSLGVERTRRPHHKPRTNTNPTNNGSNNKQLPHDNRNTTLEQTTATTTRWF